MGARIAIGARWWGGTYRTRPPYVFPEGAPIDFIPLLIVPDHFAESRKAMQRLAIWLLNGTPSPRDPAVTATVPAPIP